MEYGSLPIPQPFLSTKVVTQESSLACAMLHRWRRGDSFGTSSSIHRVGGRWFRSLESSESSQFLADSGYRDLKQ